MSGLRNLHCTDGKNSVVHSTHFNHSKYVALKVKMPLLISLKKQLVNDRM